MINKKTDNTSGRVNSFGGIKDGAIGGDGDLNDFKPKTTHTETLSKDDIDRIANANGFVSRQGSVTQAEKSVVRRGRYTTGRNQQLNIKVTQDTLQRFYAIADQLKQPLGEVFEQAVMVFEKYLENSRPGGADSATSKDGEA